MSDFTSNSASASGNRIFLIRHGESEANVASLIVSDPKDGIDSWGLTERGGEQAIEACVKLQELVSSNHKDSLSQTLVIISSDFKRTKETADILHQNLHPTTPVKLEPRLRERDFGSFNLTEASNYYKVWEEDEKDASHTMYDCESVLSVFDRTFKLLQELDEFYKNKVIVLVSHGDTVQITRTGFAGLTPSEHKKLPNLSNCELVELTRRCT